MKRLPVFLVIMSLIVGSLFSAVHAHAEGFSDSNTQIIQSMDSDSDSHGSSNIIGCEQCCHAGCHIAFNNQSSTNHAPASSKHFISSGESYLSQLNSPPFQPPRA